MKSLRNAPSVWLDKAGIQDVFDKNGVWVGGWGPLVKACQATIQIQEGSPEWEQAYARWIAGKPPTDDPAWKAGVWFCLI